MVLLFTACSSKRVYEPKDVKDDWEYYGNADESIADTTSNVALLEDGRVRTKDGILNVYIKEDYRLIGVSDGWVISANFDGSMILQHKDKSTQKHFSLGKTIAAASIKDDILAVLFSDNEMALYSMNTKALLLKEQGSAPIVVDSRIVNPYFMKDLIMFLTLDGKLVIVNSKLKKKLRTVIISSAENFNNIIYFNIIDNKLIVATGNKILSMSKKEIRANYEIRNVANNGKNIYLTTKQGEVVYLTPDLQVNKKVKFPFAHFLGLIASGNKVYALEKEGYIIELSKDLQKYDVYDVGVDEGNVFQTDEKFFVDDEFISIKQ